MAHAEGQGTAARSVQLLFLGWAPGGQMASKAVAAVAIAAWVQAGNRLVHLAVGAQQLAQQKQQQWCHQQAVAQAAAGNNSRHVVICKDGARTHKRRGDEETKRRRRYSDGERSPAASVYSYCCSVTLYSILIAAQASCIGFVLCL